MTKVWAEAVVKPSPSQSESSHFKQVCDIKTRDETRLLASVLHDLGFVNHQREGAGFLRERSPRCASDDGGGAQCR
jgi:hypothetical protein